MEWRELLWYVAIVAGGTVGVVVLVHLAWRIDGLWRIRRAGPRRLWAARHRIWHRPASGEADLRFGPGGRSLVPAPPFRFVREHLSGSQPCVAVRDARGRLWRAKWGSEAKPEAFAVRVAHALGYFAEVTHYVAEGRIEGAAGLTRTRDLIAGDGTFRDARLELEDRGVRMLFDEHSWAWNDNPFVGTRQLAGLKLLVMLLSNWDTKDRRDVSRGSNTAIFEHRVSRWAREARYLITDWGGAMGRWGATVVTRGRWDPADFEEQTPAFVTGVQDGVVSFGYQGQRTAEIAQGIQIEDVRWFCQQARGLTDAALHAGLLASGATPAEATRFTRALRARLRQLEDVCGFRAEEGQRTVGAG